MGWNDIPKPKPTPPGEWEAFSYGDYRGWNLRCGPGFIAQITGGGDKYFTMLNGEGIAVQSNLLKAQIAVELAIVKGVREMLPGYKVIVERLNARYNKNVIPMKPKE
jgi:hypothetical protein